MGFNEDLGAEDSNNPTAGPSGLYLGHVLSAILRGHSKRLAPHANSTVTTPAGKLLALPLLSLFLLSLQMSQAIVPLPPAPPKSPSNPPGLSPVLLAL